MLSKRGSNVRQSDLTITILLNTIRSCKRSCLIAQYPHSWRMRMFVLDNAPVLSYYDTTDLADVADKEVRSSHSRR